MPVIDLHFPVLGQTLPADHGYALYAALARLLPSLHGDGSPVSVGPIRGRYTGNGLLALDMRRSRLRLRLRAEDIPLVLPLAGKPLDVAGHPIRLGVPQVRALFPAPSLVARLVTIKGFTEPAGFLQAARRQLDALRRTKPAFDGDATLLLGLMDGDTAALFSDGDGYMHVLMPVANGAVPSGEARPGTAHECGG
jgi:CRISPR-associated protein Cas6